MRPKNGSKQPSTFYRKSLLAVAVLALGAGFIAAPVGFFLADADTATSPPTSDPDQNNAISNLQAEIAQYQAQLTQLASAKNTLQNAVTSLDLQQKKVTASISVTQAKINQASAKLGQLGGSITDKSNHISDDKTAIASLLAEQNQASDTTVVEMMFSADGPSSLWDDISAIAKLSDTLKDDVADLTVTKQSLTKDYNTTQDQKTQLVSLKSQLASQQADLAATKKQKTALLAQTNDNESTYQKLLSQAQAELASFSAFTQNAGGSKLLANQTSCDSWGCYYNQRDTQWGNISLSGTSDRLAADGCLVTSMAMVLTHYGYTDVTPVSVNSNPANFSAVGGLMLNTVYVDGISAKRITASIDSTLATGNPVIVGIHAYGGTHFVVLTKGSKGSYTMRDPYIANGKDISFTANYSIKSIYEVNKVIVQG